MVGILWCVGKLLLLVVFRLWLSRPARWRIAGQTQWHQVNGTVTTTETSSPFNLYFADSYGTTSN